MLNQTSDKCFLRRHEKGLKVSSIMIYYFHTQTNVTTETKE